DKEVFMRLTKKGPFYPPRVQKVVETIKYRDLPADKLQQVKQLVAEFADVFALSVWEVKLVNFIKFRLNVPKDTKFPLKVHQKLLTQAQSEWYLPVLDDFNEAGILRDIRADEVKAVHPMVLAQKAY
ncbi:hypothetical protein PISMIDRAFT_83860, partial [Pisolithus microcarpus 441]